MRASTTVDVVHGTQLSRRAELMRQLYGTEQRVLFAVVYLLLVDAPAAEMLWRGFERLLLMRLAGEIDTRDPAVLDKDWERSLLLHCLVYTDVGAPQIAAPFGNWIMRYQLPSLLRYLWDAEVHHGYWHNSNGGMDAFAAHEMRDDYDSD